VTYLQHDDDSRWSLVRVERGSNSSDRSRRLQVQDAYTTDLQVNQRLIAWTPPPNWDVDVADPLEDAPPIPTYITDSNLIAVGLTIGKLGHPCPRLSRSLKVIGRDADRSATYDLYTIRSVVTFGQSCTSSNTERDCWGSMVNREKLRLTEGRNVL